MNVGLYFGSFNPIHIGHLIIANHLAENSNLNEIWMVVTPHNPFKKKSSLLDNHHRLEMVYLATESYPKLKPSNIEFALPQPNYTSVTLAHLQERYPTYTFSLIMGEDNLHTFHKWYNYETILNNHTIYVYPRISKAEESKVSLPEHPNIQSIKAPIIEISSTHIRSQIKETKNVMPLLPEKVHTYIDHNMLYKK